MISLIKISLHYKIDLALFNSAQYITLLIKILGIRKPHADGVGSIYKLYNYLGS